MALIKFGGGILEMRGSIGGNVFSRNRYGSYVRQRTTPVNPNSARQQAVRNYLTSLVEHWRATLTQNQRDAWAVYADAISVANSLGEQIKLSGYNHYIRSNSAILNVGGTRVDEAPVDLTLPGGDGLFAVAGDATAQEIDITFDDDLTWVDESGGYLSILMSMPKGEGITFNGGPYRYAGVIAGDDTTPPTTPEGLSAPFPIAEDHKIECIGRIIRADGRVSAPFRDKGTVAAGGA